MSFEIRFKEIRKLMKISQKNMAADLSIPQSCISSYELGKTKPSFEILQKICLKYKINMSWLFTGMGDPFLESNPQSKQDMQFKIDNLKIEIESLQIENQKLKNEILELYRKINSSIK